MSNPGHEGMLCMCGGERNFSVAVFEFEVEQDDIIKVILTRSGAQ